MSDVDRATELAVEAELRAFEPDRVPPFEELPTRRWSPVSRPSGGVLLVGVAAGVVGVVVVSSVFARVADAPALGVTSQPAAVTPSASEEVSASERPPVSEFFYHLSYLDATAYQQSQADALDACMALPGTHDGITYFSLPPQFSLIVTGTAEVEVFESCVEEIDNIQTSRGASSPEPTP